MIRGKSRRKGECVKKERVVEEIGGGGQDDMMTEKIGEKGQERGGLVGKGGGNQGGKGKEERRCRLWSERGRTKEEMKEERKRSFFRKKTKEERIRGKRRESMKVLEENGEEIRGKRRRNM